jgi:hypothetical protein
MQTTWSDNNLGSMAGFVQTGLVFLRDMDDMRAERLEQTIAMWKETQNYPRKLKKKVRKELRLDFAIYSWNPYKNLLESIGHK